MAWEGGGSAPTLSVALAEAEETLAAWFREHLSATSDQGMPHLLIRFSMPRMCHPCLRSVQCVGRLPGWATSSRRSSGACSTAAPPSSSSPSLRSSTRVPA